MSKWSNQDYLSLAFRPWKTLQQKSEQEQAQKAMQRQKAIFGATDFNPQYVTKRAQSPQARAYMESFLSGSNPDAISSVTPNANIKKAAAQNQKDAMFGTNDQLIQQGRDLRNEPLPDVEKDQEAQIYAAHNPNKTLVQQNADVPPEFIDWFYQNTGTKPSGDESKDTKDMEYFYDIAKKEGWSPDNQIRVRGLGLR